MIIQGRTTVITALGLAVSHKEGPLWALRGMLMETRAPTEAVFFFLMETV